MIQVLLASWKMRAASCQTPPPCSGSVDSHCIGTQTGIRTMLGYSKAPEAYKVLSKLKDTFLVATAGMVPCYSYSQI